MGSPVSTCNENPWVFDVEIDISCLRVYDLVRVLKLRHCFKVYFLREYHRNTLVLNLCPDDKDQILSSKINTK